MANRRTMQSIECDCGMDVFGRSEEHARQNLKIHRNISKKHKEFLSIKKKWLDFKRK